MAAAMIVLSSSIALAQETVPGDRVYVLHSKAQGTCPALDWHIVASPNGALSGMLELPDRQTVATISGSIVRNVEIERFGLSLGGDPQVQHVRMVASEVGGHHRIVDITGIILSNGWMVAEVEGPGVSCKDITAPLFVPAK